MQRIFRGFMILIAAGLVVAVLRQFGWDPFAAFGWMVSEVWAVISHVADLFQQNDTFQEVTKKPNN